MPPPPTPIIFPSRRLFLFRLRWILGFLFSLSFISSFLFGLFFPADENEVMCGVRGVREEGGNGVLFPPSIPLGDLFKRKIARAQRLNMAV